MVASYFGGCRWLRTLDLTIEVQAQMAIRIARSAQEIFVVAAWFSYVSAQN
jgi:hypothetical protein